MANRLKFFYLTVVVILIANPPLWSEDIPVTNLLDSGAGSFREALLNTNKSDRIVFDSALSGTLTLLSSLPSIDTDRLIILGPTSGSVEINGNGLFSVFKVGANLEMEISDLHIASAATTDSGAALFMGSVSIVTVSNISFSDCVAMGTEGGAIHIGLDALFNATDITFSNNSSAGFGDDVFLRLGGTFKDICTKDIPQLDISGSGQLMKRGAGKATFTASGTPPLTFVIEEGIAVATGVRTQPSIVYGELIGSQTSLYIANHGSVKPSETIGTMITTNNYQQDGRATLKIALSSDGSTDLLQVGGNAHIEGTLSIFPEAGTYKVGTTYTIIEAAGALDANFSLVTSTSMTFKVHYFSDHVDIEVIEI